MRVNRASFSSTTIGSVTGHTDCDSLAVLFMENTLALSSLNVLRQAFQSISEKHVSMYLKRSTGCAASGDPRVLGMVRNALQLDPVTFGTGFLPARVTSFSHDFFPPPRRVLAIRLAQYSRQRDPPEINNA